MTSTFFRASIGASLVIVHIGSAFAQTTPGSNSVLTRSAADLTCSDLVGMDDQGVGNILYYVAGYTARGSADAPAEATAADDAEPAHALAPTGSDNTADAAASGSASAGAATETKETEAPDDSPGATLELVGGFEIDVKQALSDCEAAPEAGLVDILDQQRASNSN